MIDNLFAVAGAIVNSSIPVIQPTRRRSRAVTAGNTLHVRSDIVSIRSLQGCPRIEPDIWPTSNQRLKGRNNRDRSTYCHARMVEPWWIMAVRGDLLAYIFGKSPVLERIKNDQGFISAVGNQGQISSVSNQTSVLGRQPL